MEEQKKRAFSAVQPSGTLTLGNYLGAIRNFVAMQEEFDCIYATANLHAITVRQESAKLRNASYDLYAWLIASGIDTDKSIIFHQSMVHEHAELAWVLECNTQYGELSRMTQFKDKSARHEDNINAGLFTYPSLMAADILLYQADLVPVGDDQRQHLELTRDVAVRFNNVYGDTFKIPQAYIPKRGARIMNLQEPSKKMSKSDENQRSYILLTDSKDQIIKKFRSAVTDSDACVRYDDSKPGIKNLMEIYSACSGKSFDEIEKEFEGRGYGDFKTAAGEAAADMLAPVQSMHGELIKDKRHLEALAAQGAEKAAHIAMRTIQKVYKKVGLLR